MTIDPTRAVESVINGLKSSPVLLALISLNIIGVGAALWFLRALAAAQASRFDLLLKYCLPGVKP